MFSLGILWASDMYQIHGRYQTSYTSPLRVGSFQKSVQLIISWTSHCAILSPKKATFRAILLMNSNVHDKPESGEDNKPRVMKARTVRLPGSLYEKEE